MATGLTTSTTIDNVVPVILSAAREAHELPTVMSSMVQKVSIKDGQGETYNWPKFDTLLDAQTLSEGTPINNPQKLIPTSHQFTTSEVGVHVVLTDKAVRVTPEAMMARAGRFMGNALKRKKEQDLLSLISGLSRDLGTAGNAFDPTDIANAYTRLKAGAEAGQTEVAEGQVYAVIHPFHYSDIIAAAPTLGSNINSTSGYMPIEGITEQVIRNYHLKELYNTVLAMAPLMDIDASDDAVAGVFTREAFLLVNTSVSMRMEKERDIFLRANAMVMTSEYGTGELEDQFGIAITADATVPA